MAETNKTQEDNASPKEVELADQVKKLQEQLKTESTLREKVLDDNAIREVLQARKDGKEISVVLKEAQQPAPTLREKLVGKPKADQSKSQIDLMSNAELIDIIVPAVEETITSAVKGARDDATHVVETRLGTIESNQGKLHDALLKQAAASGVMTMRSQYGDFDKFSQDALTEMKNTGLSLEDAYLLVKARAGSTVPERSQVDTERPSSAHVSKPRNENSQREPARPRSSVRNFRSIVQEGVDNVLRERNY